MESQGQGSINIYFVANKSSYGENESKIQQLSFQACKENCFDPSWISAEECLKISFTRLDVFICDPFEGEAFEYLTTSGSEAVVLGPRCLMACFHNKIPIPELPIPLHNLAMYKVVATCTGFEASEKCEIKKMIQRMCGVYSNTFNLGITHLIANVVGSDKYVTAVQQKTPIMSSEWVYAVWKASCEESDKILITENNRFQHLICPPFKGLNICVSQVSRQEKQALKILIEENGGKYTAELDLNTTNALVTPNRDGTKFKFALQWRIPCLIPKWIYDSVEQKVSLPQENYKVSEKVKISTPTNDQSTGHFEPDISSIEAEQSSTLCLRTKVDETADQTFLFSKKPETERVNVACLQAFEYLNLMEATRVGSLFDGCKIFTYGLSDMNGEKMRRILNAGAAIRFSVLNESVTHVVAGKIDAEIRKTITALTSKPKLVTPDWIVKCITTRSLVNEDEFLIHLSDDEPMKQLRCNDDAQTSRCSESYQAEKTLIDDQIMRQYMKSADCSANEEITTLPDTQLPNTSPDIFKDLVFAVSGYADETCGTLVELIMENGGIVVDGENDRRNVIHYSVVAVDGTGGFVSKAAKHVTYFYIQECIESEVLLPVKYYHMPFLWNPRDNVLEGCVIACTQFDGKEREFIEYIVAKMGATYQSLLARRDNASKGVVATTHLISSQNEGTKVEAATKWGIFVVGVAWLMMCVQNECKVSELEYDLDSKVDSEAVLSNLWRKMNGIELPAHKSIKNLKAQTLTVEQIKTPDLDTLRKMYPTPGNKRNISDISTPDTPYGCTWYENPTASVRKGIKRLLNTMPDPNDVQNKTTAVETPTPVLIERTRQNIKSYFENVPKLNFDEDTATEHTEDGAVNRVQNSNEIQRNDGTTENVPPSNYKKFPVPDKRGILYGVVVSTSKKLADTQRLLYKTVSELGGDYRWSFDSSVTHFLHSGTANDRDREFRIAKKDGANIVAPDWVWACKEENIRVEETLYPHNYNAKLQLSLVSTRCSQSKKRQKVKEKGERKEQECDENTQSLNDETISEQIEEIKRFVLTTDSAQKRSANLSGRHTFKCSPKKIEENLKETQTTNPEHESQGTAITWVDPKDQEARARLQLALESNTQEALGQNVEKVKSYLFALSGVDDEQRKEYIAAIDALGAKFLDVRGFDASITHLVTSQPTRSEKHLGVIASGKWMVNVTFLDESISRGSFVNEEPHEWGNEKAARNLPILEENSTSQSLAVAGYRWRNLIQTNMPPAFHSVNAAVFASDTDKHNSFVNLIRAGGGTIVSEPLNNLNLVTHFFIQGKKFKKKDFTNFASNDILCVHANFIHSRLVDPSSDVYVEDVVPEYMEIIKNIGSSTLTFKSRTRR